MSNGIGKRRTYEMLQSCLDEQTGTRLDFHKFVEMLANDVESGGDSPEAESNVPRWFVLVPDYSREELGKLQDGRAVPFVRNKWQASMMYGLSKEFLDHIKEEAAKP